MRHEIFPREDQRQPSIGRAEERLPFDVVTDVKVGCGAWRKARLTDVSVHGFKIAWLPNAQPGQSLMIRIPAIEPLPASIRRSGTTGVGCEFTRPLSVYVLEHLARHGMTR